MTHREQQLPPLPLHHVICRLAVLLWVVSTVSVAVGTETIIVPLSSTADFTYPVVLEKHKGEFLEIDTLLPTKTHDHTTEYKLCCILEQSVNITITTTATNGTTTTTTVVEEWVPLKTVFCNHLYYTGKQEVFKSLEPRALSRWDENPGVQHRLRFTSDCSDVVGLSVTLRQSFISGSTQEYIALGLLLAACLTLCTDRACRSNVLYVFCVLSFICLALCNKFPSSATVLSWIDANTLFTKMAFNYLISSLNGTGVHGWVAYRLLRISHGRPRALAFAMWIFTGLVAVFLPGMATVYFVTKITLIACEALKINPIPVVMGQIVMTNIGSMGLALDPTVLIVIKYFDVPSYMCLYFNLLHAVFCGVIIAGMITFFYSRELLNKPVLWFSPVSSPQSSASSPFTSPQSSSASPVFSPQSSMPSPRFPHTNTQTQTQNTTSEIELTDLSSTTQTTVRRRQRNEPSISEVINTPGLSSTHSNTSNNNNNNKSEHTSSSLPASLRTSPVLPPTLTTSSVPPPPPPSKGVITVSAIAAEEGTSTTTTTTTTTTSSSTAILNSPRSLANDGSLSPKEVRSSKSESSDVGSLRTIRPGSPETSSTGSSMDQEESLDPNNYRIKNKRVVQCVVALVIVLNIYSLVFDVVGLDFCLFAVLLSSVYAIRLKFKKIEVIYEFFPLENLLLITLSFIFIGSLENLGLSRIGCK